MLPGRLEWTSRGSWPRTLQVCTRPHAACHSLQYSCPTTTKYWCMWRIQYQWFVVARVWQLQNRREEERESFSCPPAPVLARFKSSLFIYCNAMLAERKSKKYNFFFWKNNRCTCVFVWCKLITMLLCWTIVLYDVNLLLNCGVLEYCVMSN